MIQKAREIKLVRRNGEKKRGGKEEAHVDVDAGLGVLAGNVFKLVVAEQVGENHPHFLF